MSMTFQRYEQKYLLGESEYRALQAELTRWMKPDRHCQEGRHYAIYNIYYDTPDDELIRRSLAKPYYKEKLRLRSYTVPSGPDDQVFLEIKKKFGGIVTKRRAEMTLGEAEAFVASGRKPPGRDYLHDQVVSELVCFRQRYPVQPKVLISYDRIAYYGRDDSEFRLTFDRNLLSRRDQLRLELGAGGRELLTERPYLMEIKVSAAIPLWLSHALADLRLYSTSFSKYGAEYELYRRQQPLPTPLGRRLAARLAAPALQPGYSVN